MINFNNTFDDKKKKMFLGVFKANFEADIRCFYTKHEVY